VRFHLRARMPHGGKRTGEQAIVVHQAITSWK
jgi:hypothetical protein